MTDATVTLLRKSRKAASNKGRCEIAADDDGKALECHSRGVCSQYPNKRTNIVANPLYFSMSTIQHIRRQVYSSTLHFLIQHFLILFCYEYKTNASNQKLLILWHLLLLFYLIICFRSSQKECSRWISGSQFVSEPA